MKHLLIMRHAEASSGLSPNQRDFDRPLTAYGQKQCAMQRQRLIAQNLCPDLIVHSSALRTQQTAQLTAPRPDIGLVASDALYNGHGHDANDNHHHYLAIAAAHGANSQCLLLIGHNPVISALGSYLTGLNATTHDAHNLAASYFSPATLMGFALPDDASMDRPDAGWQTLFCWVASGG
ncbi:MAG: hypothetical protein FJX22_02620 [Alphaproteobacteria bacterium]|nr:hypothetical protein [Alphaproteobacteria bacterium]